MARKFRVGIIGATKRGDYGHGMDTAFNDLPQFEVVALADPDDTGRAAAGKRSGAKRLYSDFREMLEMKGLDAIQIAVPDHWHSLTAIAAARKKLDIFAEKPLALTVSEGRAMVAAERGRSMKWSRFSL